MTLPTNLLASLPSLPKPAARGGAPAARRSPPPAASSASSASSDDSDFSKASASTAATSAASGAAKAPSAGKPGKAARSQLPRPLARAWHAALTALALALAYLAGLLAHLGLTKNATAKTGGAVPYPDFQAVCAHFSRGKRKPADVRACLAFLVANDLRFAEDLALVAQAGAEAPLTKAQRTLLARERGAMTQALVNIKLRSTATWRAAVPAELAYSQRFGHVESDADGPQQICWDRTLSSEAIKGDLAKGRSDLLAYNANLGGIFAGDRGERGELVLVRSARSDTPARVRELLTFGAMLRPRGDGYRAAIVTALDASPSKDIATRLFGESEVDMLAAQAAAVEQLFGDAQQLNLAAPGALPLLVHRPLLLRSVMSAQANVASNRLAARASNVAAMHTLWDEFAARLDEVGGPAAFATSRLMQAAATPALRQALLARPLFRNLVAGLPPAQQAAIDCLNLHLLGATCAGSDLLAGSQAPDEALLLQALLSAAGRTPNLQCKSGQDRTLSLLSLWLAATASDDYLLGGGADAGLRGAFSAVSAAFGHGPIRDVRGQTGSVKWGFDANGTARHPVPRALLQAPRAPRAAALSLPLADQGKQKPATRF